MSIPDILPKQNPLPRGELEEVAALIRAQAPRLDRAISQGITTIEEVLECTAV